MSRNPLITSYLKMGQSQSDQNPSLLACQVGDAVFWALTAPPLNWDGTSPRAIMRTVTRVAKNEMKMKNRFYEVSAFLHKIAGILFLRCEIQFLTRLQNKISRFLNFAVLRSTENYDCARSVHLVWQEESPYFPCFGSYHTLADDYRDKVLLSHPYSKVRHEP
jgi:hypothetical protein